MGGGQAKEVPERPPVPEGKVRVCVAGFSISHHTHRARKVADAIVEAHPDKYESWYFFDSKGYKAWLPKLKEELPDAQKTKFAAHKSSPFCWLEHPDGTRDAKGGRDFLCEWAAAEFKDNAKIQKLATTGPTIGEVIINKTPGTANVPVQKA